MANAEPINLQIDPVHLRTQIKKIIDDELIAFSTKLRHAADVLDPEYQKWQDQWLEDQIEKRIATRLKEEQNGDS